LPDRLKELKKLTAILARVGVNTDRIVVNATDHILTCRKK